MSVHTCMVCRCVWIGSSGSCCCCCWAAESEVRGQRRQRVQSAECRVQRCRDALCIADATWYLQPARLFVFVFSLHASCFMLLHAGITTSQRTHNTHYTLQPFKDKQTYIHTRSKTYTHGFSCMRHISPPRVAKAERHHHTCRH